MKIAIKAATVSIEDHPTIAGRFVIMCGDAQGREYTHDASFWEGYAFDVAHRLMLKVQKVGMIDVTLWQCRVPYGSDAWDADGMEVTLYDDAERARFGL